MNVDLILFQNVKSRKTDKKENVNSNRILNVDKLHGSTTSVVRGIKQTE